MEDKDGCGGKFSRRVFLGAAAGGTLAVGGLGLGLGLGRFLSPLTSAAAASAETAELEFTVRTVCSPNCTGACGQLAYIRGGRVVKIQQASDYPDTAYNPRGCMKGLSFMQSIYGPDRVRYPFIRVGNRGEGKWKRVSWDEAMAFIAGRMADIASKYGWKSVYFFPQLPGTGPVQKGAATRLAALLGASHGTFYDFNGDLPLSMPITFGVQCSDHEAKDWSNARYILFIGANPVESRIPDAHFIFDAAAKGAKLVVVDPSFSPTAAKADKWVPIKPGTDGALALGMVKVIIDEGWADMEYLTRFSDAPLLVNDATGKRLRESDVVEGGGEDRYLVWDQTAAGPVVVPSGGFGLPRGAAPALEGEFDVVLKNGERVPASPGFRYILDALKSYTPEAVSEITEVPAGTITDLARGFATARPAAIIMGAGGNHWYHSDLSGRALALLSAVTGNVGRSGGGISIYVGQYKVRFDTSSWWFPDGRKPNFIPPIYLIHGPTSTISPDIKLPENGFRAILVSHSNMFNQSPNLNRLFERLDQMELIVVMEFAMTPTAEYADVILPAATWYEKMDLIATPLHPYLQLMQPAVQPQFESRPELEIYRDLAGRLDPSLSAHFEMDEEQIVSMLLADGGPEVDGVTLDQLKAGPVRLNVPDPEVTFHEQIENGVPFPSRTYPFPLEATRRFVKTGRMEFYKDEDRFLELGEQVPVYKPPIEADADNPKAETYPLVLISPHSRWRVHSTYSNVPWLLEITGGKPRVVIHPSDAEKRGIATDDLVDLFNDRGLTTCWAVVSEQARPGTAVLYEGWWTRYFRRGRGVNELTSDVINPTNEIYFLPNVWSPVTAWKEVLCDLRKSEGDSDV